MDRMSLQQNGAPHGRLQARSDQGAQHSIETLTSRTGGAQPAIGNRDVTGADQRIERFRVDG